MNKEELIELVTLEVKGLKDKLDSNDHENAVANAQRETGWALPQTSDFRVQWLKERTKRWLIYFLQVESASKFKFEQINLQQRFSNYTELLKMMDQQFKDAIEENPSEFAGVDAFRMFGTKIDAGFSYDDLGADTTYSQANLVIIEPGDSA